MFETLFTIFAVLSFASDVLTSRYCDKYFKLQNSINEQLVNLVVWMKSVVLCNNEEINELKKRIDEVESRLNGRS